MSRRASDWAALGMGMSHSAVPVGQMSCREKRAALRGTTGLPDNAARELST